LAPPKETFMSLLGRIISSGRAAQPAPPRPAAGAVGPSGPVLLGKSVQLRHVDAGSCNGCELEISSAFGPVYDAERYGLRLVASPRHADALLVTGPVTRNMAEPLRKTYQATPGPKRVVAVGDCARNCGVFAGGHGVEGAVRDVLPVDVEVPGCPPHPEVLIEALRGLTGR
jgi:Ni,Fe-hydrogenase III small subunit